MATPTTENIYGFSVQDSLGKPVSLNQYEGKVLLIVNTASKCGFTPQYDGLEKLYEKYQNKGLVVLGFPCNQFGGQEPGDSAEIANFCSLTYSVKFPVFHKIEVNGAGESPVYGFLKGALPGLLGSELIKWNFTKFLVDRTGKPSERFAPQTKPEDLTGAIEKLLG